MKTPFEYYGYKPSSEEEKKFFENYDPNKWEKASNTCDTAVFAVSDAGLELLLVKRGGYPYKGKYCLPGGFINMSESLYDTALRELEEETGLTGLPVFQVGTYGEPGREPRDRSITTLYTSIFSKNDLAARAGDDASDIDWVLFEDFDHQIITTENTAEHYISLSLKGRERIFTPEIKIMESFGRYKTVSKSITDTGGLAFDHALLAIDAYIFIRNRILCSDISMNVLGKEFKLTELKALLRKITLEPFSENILAGLSLEKAKNGLWRYSGTTLF